MATISTCWKCLLLVLLIVAVTIRNTNSRTFNITCDLYNQQDCNSMTLTEIAASIEEENHVQINIIIPFLHLNDTIRFSNLTSLTITGESGSTAIMCIPKSHANAGIILRNITDRIILRNFNLSNCGSKFNNDHNASEIFRSALTIVHSRSVEMTGIVVINSKGLGLTLLNLKGGKVEILSSKFVGNKPPKEYLEKGKPKFRGGGIYIAIEQHNNGQYSDTSFIFEDCIFLNNNNSVRTNRLAFTESYGHGGGVYLSLKHSLVNVYVSFLRCQFLANHAFAGGGLSINVQGERNNHNIKLTNVTFINNCAEFGGAIHYTSHPRQSNSYSMQLDGCMFKHNRGHIGSAVAMIPNHSSLKWFTEYSLILTFTKCYFQDNFVYEKHFQFNEAQRNSGVGTIYTSLYNLHFEGTNEFKNNLGSGLFVVNGIVNLTTSELSFINNSGINGGAVALIGTSKIILGQNRYEFINNTALHRGGAIYVDLIDHTDFTVSGNCFVQHIDGDLSTEWNATINFKGNKALYSLGGHAVYATSLYPCQIVNVDDVNQSEYTSVDDLDIFKMHGIKLDSDDTLQPQIATDGSQLKLTKSMPLPVIPGENHHHGVIMTDDLGQPADALYQANVNSKSGSIKLNPANFTFIGSNIYITGEPDSKTSLYIHPVSPRHNYIEVDINLLRCPPGFKLNNHLECACNAHAQFGLFKCDDNKFHSYLLLGYWAGYINKVQLLTSECPFCDFSDSLTSASEFELALPKHFSELDELVCGKTRTGVVCGKCRDNNTVHFHSPAFMCKPSEPVGCKLGWFFYVISELVPVTAVFVLVFVFNISFTSGAINGFILFSQLLGSLDIYAGGITVFSTTEKRKFDDATQGYRVLYGFFNLDFFNAESLSFCLWKNASALDMLAFKYVTILYAILLVVAVICIMNKCGGRCLARYYRISTVKVTVIHGISTFLVICYAQCVRISFNLLLPVHLHTAQNEKSIEAKSRVRVWFNGELTHLGKDHWIYAAPAIFCLLTVGLIPPFLLLIYPLSNKILALFGLEEKKPFHLFLSTSWLKPLLDSFQGCFKDNLRFFAGLYFLYRWTFLLFHWGTGNFSAYYTGTGGILVFMLTLHTICQPYIKRVHNIIDTLLFANLVLINYLSFFNYHKTRSQRIQYSATVSAAIVQQVLIYLPLIVIGVYFALLLIQQILKCAIRHNSQILDKRPKVMKLIRIINLKGKLMESIEEEFVFDRISDEDMEYEEFEEREL